MGGRRAGKTTLLEQLEEEAGGRRIVRANALAWRRASEEEVMEAFRARVGAPAADRRGVEAHLRSLAPVTILIDEADALLHESWSRSLFQWFRYLDEGGLGSGLAFVLAGGPLLDGWEDPDDRGSPPLNNAVAVYLDPLDPAAVDAWLEGLSVGTTTRRALGGHPWLLTLLADALQAGADEGEALDLVADQAQRSIRVWARQLGPEAAALLAELVHGPIPHVEFGPLGRRARMRTALLRCRYLMTARRTGDLWSPDGQLLSGLLAAAPVHPSFDLAISHAREDEATARAVADQLRGSFHLFFDLDEEAWLWGEPLHDRLPQVFEVEARQVLVLWTAAYRDKYWTRLELNAGLRAAADRLLVVAEIDPPPELPADVLYLKGTPAVWVRLVERLRQRLAG